MRETLEIEATRVEVLVEESYHPDDLAVIPDNYRGPELVAVAYSNQLAAMTPAGRSVVALSVREAADIIAAARGAREERVRTGVDTALDRVLTTIRVRFEDPRGAAGSFALVGVVNHSAPHALPPSWSLLLRLLRDAAGRVSEIEAEAWDRALTWIEPLDLGEVWRDGGVVKLTSIVTALECLDVVYVRVGQPPHRSALYRINARGTLHAIVREGVDEQELLPVDRYTLRWRLPCGGGTLAFHHEWQRPARVVIRVDDAERGIYVQRG